MKRYSILALALVLGCTLFTGCRRGPGNMATVPPMTQTATERPTTATMPSTTPTRPIATAPATEATDSTGSTGEAATGETGSGSTQSPSGKMMPGGR